MITEIITLQDKVSGLVAGISQAANVEKIHLTGDPALDLESYRKNKINYIVCTPISDEPLHQPESTEDEVIEDLIVELDQTKQVSRLLSLQVMFLTEDDADPYARQLAERFEMSLEGDDNLELFTNSGFAIQDIGPIIDVDFKKGDWLQRRSALELQLNYTASSTERMSIIEVIDLIVVTIVNRTITIDREITP